MPSEQLPPEAQRLLGAASVAGLEFSAAAAAAGVEADVLTVEEQCAGLARRGQCLRTSGIAEWPDGTVVGRYRFVHALYQQVVYDLRVEPVPWVEYGLHKQVWLVHRRVRPPPRAPIRTPT